MILTVAFVRKCELPILNFDFCDRRNVRELKKYRRTPIAKRCDDLVNRYEKDFASGGDAKLRER